MTPVQVNRTVWIDGVNTRGAVIMTRTARVSISLRTFNRVTQVLTIRPVRLIVRLAEDSLQ